MLSNLHVVTEADRVMVRTKTGLLSAQVVKTDPANNLALLKISGNLSGSPLISHRSAKLGGTVAMDGLPTIGPQGFAPKLAKVEFGALISAPATRTISQSMCPFGRATRGGAQADEPGKVVGMVSAKMIAKAAVSTSGALPENLNYAVKSTLLLSFR